MTILYALSIHGGSDAQNAKVVEEMEKALGSFDDPLAILIAEEESYSQEELDVDVSFWSSLS